MAPPLKRDSCEEELRLRNECKRGLGLGPRGRYLFVFFFSFQCVVLDRSFTRKFMFQIAMRTRKRNSVQKRSTNYDSVYLFFRVTSTLKFCTIVINHANEGSTQIRAYSSAFVRIIYKNSNVSVGLREREISNYVYAL